MEMKTKYIDLFEKFLNENYPNITDLYKQMNDTFGTLEYPDKITSYNKYTNYYNSVNVEYYDRDIYINPENFGNIKLIDGFNKLKKLNRGCSIDIVDNPLLTSISGFKNLISTDHGIYIKNNPNLIEIIGFDNLEKIGYGLYIGRNLKLISISIPGNMIKSSISPYEPNEIFFWCDSVRYRTPEMFINSPQNIHECVGLFNPEIHSDVVIKQIIDNLKEWGNDDTISFIINNLLRKYNFSHLIPEYFYKFIDDKHKSLWF